MQVYADIFRFPVKDYYLAVGFDFDKVPFETYNGAFIDQYEVRKFECSVRPEGIELLKLFNEVSIPQSVISASNQISLHEIVKHYGIFNQFISVRGLDNHHAFGKLDIGRQWMQELALPSKEVLMIGDTLHDHELAQQLGIDCVLLCSGHQSRARLSASGLPVFESLSGLEF